MNKLLKGASLFLLMVVGQGLETRGKVHNLIPKNPQKSEPSADMRANECLLQLKEFSSLEPKGVARILGLSGDLSLFAMKDLFKFCSDFELTRNCLQNNESEVSRFFITSTQSIDFLCSTQPNATFNCAEAASNPDCDLRCEANSLEALENRMETAHASIPKTATVLARLCSYLDCTVKCGAENGSRSCSAAMAEFLQLSLDSVKQLIRDALPDSEKAKSWMESWWPRECARIGSNPTLILTRKGQESLPENLALKSQMNDEIQGGNKI